MIHSSCLYVDWVFLTHREWKSTWQIVSDHRFVNDKFVSGKLSKYLLIYCYTHPITLSTLNRCLLVHNFYNSCSTGCHWKHVPQKSFEVWLDNNCHKINLRGPFEDFLFYVILTISYLKAKRHHYSTLQCAPFLANQANRDFFWYTDCIFKNEYLSLHKCELLRCLLRISDSGQNTCKGNKVRKCTYHNFSSSSHVIIKVMINTCQNSSWSFPLTKKWWYEHSATFPHPSNDKGMAYTYNNFCS